MTKSRKSRKPRLVENLYMMMLCTLKKGQENTVTHEFPYENANLPLIWIFNSIQIMLFRYKFKFQKKKNQNNLGHATENLNISDNF